MLLKRGFDIVVSFLGLLLLSPVFMVIILLIKIRMPGRIFFRQERIGQDGKIFTMFKFRTMTENHNGDHITVKGDNRVTPVGYKLRKYKLDELPELWNVLKGEMSFVGPRPDVPGYADSLIGRARDILRLKPGITGPATVRYYNEEEILASKPDPRKYNDEILYPDKVRLNLEYLENRSLIGDIKLIWKSVVRKY